MIVLGKGFIQILACFFKVRRNTRLKLSSCLLLILPFSRETNRKLPVMGSLRLLFLKNLFLREKLFFHKKFLGESSISLKG